MASTYLTRTQSSDTSNTNFTFSCWFKRSNLGNQCIYATQTGSDEVRFEFDTNDKLFCYKYNGSSFAWNLYTERYFRDTNAWYHFVLQYDSTQSTASDRLKMYINGVQETVFQSGYENYPSSSSNSFAFQGGTAYIGCNENTTQFFDGLMSHINMVHGSTPAYTSFGETDSTTGEWKIKTSPNVTYGTQGYFILKDGNTVTDSSPNSNNHTVSSGTLTNTEDCPDNVFCTLNSLGHASANFTLIEGNTYSGGADNNWRSIFGTIGSGTGKYYYEVKCISSSDYERFGACTIDQANKCTDSAGRYDDSTYGSEGYGYTSDGEKSNNGGTTGSYGDTWGANDILSCAIDLDNNKIYFGKNGTWQNSGDPTSGSTGTGAAYTIASDKIYIPAFASYGAAANLAFNFGNGYFRTSAISSEGTNASGIGKFEYDVPTGYTAFSTKGLNE